MENRIVHGSKLTEVIREKVRSSLLKNEVETLEVAEFYLVNLLMQFHIVEEMFRQDGSQAFDKPLSIMLLEAMSKSSRHRRHYLKHVGDKALVIVGFFEDSVHRSIIEPSYYISVGKSAYGHLAETHSSNEAVFEMYSELSSKFSKFVEVISAVAPWNHARSDTEILRIYERWITTGDEKLRELLEQRGISTDETIRKT